MPTQQKQARGRSKRGKKRPRPPATDDYIKVVPLRIEDDIGLPVQISKGRRAKNCKVSSDNLTFSSSTGYRSVQSNRGTFCGTWFFEIDIAYLGATGHSRLGVGTVKQEIDAPCGYTQASYGYRDVDGSKVTEGMRTPYAAPYKQGDTVGVFLHLPEGGNPNEPKTEIVRWKGKLFQTDDAPSQPAKPLIGSVLGYTVNGEWQGPAFTDILEGTYYAAASLFTKPKPDKPASVRFNFGPEFKFGPPNVDGLPAAKPFCEVPPKPPPVPEEDGTVTVDKTIVAFVKPPEDDPDEKPPQPKRPPAAPVEVQPEPDTWPTQAQPAPPVSDVQQDSMQKQDFQLDPGLLATLAGAPTGVWATPASAATTMPNAMPTDAVAGSSHHMMHSAGPAMGGPVPGGAVGGLAGDMAGVGAGQPAVGRGAVAGSSGQGQPMVGHSTAAAPRKHSALYEAGYGGPRPG
eukprot:jgi/Ulvmu1/11738/UM008_0151.1